METLLSIIVPVYNERQTIVPLLERLLAVPMPCAREILVINDGSTDGTAENLAAFGFRDGLRVLHAVRNGGKGSAVRVGLAHASGSLIAIQDADLELDPEDLPRLLQPILHGEASVVYGSRFLTGRPDAPWKTVAANACLTWLTNLLFRARITDMETCYKVMRTDLARSLNLRSNRFDIEPEITAKLLLHGHHIVERSVAFRPRARSAGKKINWRDGVRAIQILLRYRFWPADRGAVAPPASVEAHETSRPSLP
jgi:glycosyltransferase involved in cell wall biosynthesis